MQPLEQSFGSKSYGIVKASLISREILLEEVKKISNAVGSTLEDLDRTDLTLGKYETVQPSKSASPSYSYGQGTPTKCSPQMTGILRDFLEVYFTFFSEKRFLSFWISVLVDASQTCFRVLGLWLEALMISCCILYLRKNCLNYFKLSAANSHLYGMSSWNSIG